MTSTERSRAWREKIGPKAVRAYLNAKYPKYRDRILAGNKRWRDKQDPETRQQRNRSNYLKNRDEIREKSKQWRLENPERYKKFLREWRLKNPDYKQTYVQKNRDKIDEQMREWRSKNPAKIAKQSRQWKLKNQDKIRAQNRLWRFNNPARRNNAQARRRAAPVGDLIEIAKVYERARWWKQWFAVVVDHVIPLSKGGAHDAKNLQIIYGFENSRKHNNVNYKPRVIFV
jgi:hypothetical protein